MLPLLFVGRTDSPLHHPVMATSPLPITLITNLNNNHTPNTIPAFSLSLSRTQRKRERIPYYGIDSLFLSLAFILSSAVYWPLECKHTGVFPNSRFQCPLPYQQSDCFVTNISIWLTSSDTPLHKEHRQVPAYGTPYKIMNTLKIFTYQHEAYRLKLERSQSLAYFIRACDTEAYSPLLPYPTYLRPPLAQCPSRLG